jgi:hypothetical protein
LQRWDGNDVKGNTDLAARFVLRASRLLTRRGQLGYVTTNTLIEGATLRVGMEQVTNGNLTVWSARLPHPWPTKSANLQIVEFWASRLRPAKSAAYQVDGEEVPAIGPDLQPFGRVSGRPNQLRENEGICFNGSKVLGLGFTLTEDQKDALIDHNPDNSQIIQKYVIGKDLNQRPDYSARRWVINFNDWSLQRAENYPDCIDIVRRLVKPERDQNKRALRRERWWIYGERAPGLYAATDGFDHVLAIARIGSTIVPARVYAGPVFNDQTVVFAQEDFASFAILSSSAHLAWVIRYAPTLETRIIYAPSAVFVTLPRPEASMELRALGRDLDEIRTKLMLSRAWGLTRTYNRVHDPDNHEPVIQELRDIHVAIDEAVMRAYGWDDLDLKIGHHPTKIGIRWTVSKEARFELLDRLLEENHRRYKLENPS